MGIVWDFGFLIIDLESPLKSEYLYIFSKNWLFSHRFLYWTYHLGFSGTFDCYFHLFKAQLSCL